ncbi:MAG: nucleotidyltransferase substrate binding protein [Chitinophagaceae bacterium]|nr:nucleotidyltransferase substrate binding protein [Chitinophagaceae bacterium]
MSQDIRWKQRFANYEKALAHLQEAATFFDQEPMEIIKEGTIQRFEFTHELAWRVMKDYLEYQGFQSVMGSRDATREAFKYGLLEEGQVWMDMIESRNRTVHAYDAAILQQEYEKIVTSYAPLFEKFLFKMKSFL